VADRAREAAPLFGADGELLVAAALLHDIGYAPDLVDTGFHPIDGARYLLNTDAPTRLVNLVGDRQRRPASAFDLRRAPDWVTRC